MIATAAAAAAGARGGKLRSVRPYPAAASSHALAASSAVANVPRCFVYPLWVIFATHLLLRLSNETPTYRPVVRWRPLTACVSAYVAVAREVHGDLVPHELARLGVVRLGGGELRLEPAQALLFGSARDGDSRHPHPLILRHAYVA